jgi:hypothetical protein
MTEPRDTDGRPGARPAGGQALDRGRPALDLAAVLAAMQDQIDDLTAAVEAQQRTIDELTRGQRTRRTPDAGYGPRNGTGRR